MTLEANQFAEVETCRIRVTPAGKVSRADASKILGKSAKTVANWAALGIGPRVQMVGGRVFYDYDECLAMANGDKPVNPAKAV